MATITKRSNKYFARVRIKGYPTVSKTFHDLRTAKAWAFETEDAINRGSYEFDRVDIPTLADALERYRSTVSALKRSRATEYGRINWWQASKVASQTIDRIRGRDLVLIRDRMTKEYAPATIHRHFALLSHLFEVARKDWYLPVPNPVREVRLPEVRNQRSRLVGSDELQAVLQHINNKHLINVALIGFATAARLGEIVNAEWKYVDLAAKTLHLPITKNGEPRTVPLSPEAVQVLRSLPQRIDGGAIFDISANTASTLWRRAVARARAAYERECLEQGTQPDDRWLTDLHFHDLRHTAITRLAEAGFQTLELAAVSGHKSLSMLQRYTHISPAHLARKMEASL